MSDELPTEERLRPHRARRAAADRRPPRDRAADRAGRRGRRVRCCSSAAGSRCSGPIARHRGAAARRPRALRRRRLPCPSAATSVPRRHRTATARPTGRAARLRARRAAPGPSARRGRREPQDTGASAHPAGASTLCRTQDGALHVYLGARGRVPTHGMTRVPGLTGRRGRPGRTHLSPQRGREYWAHGDSRVRGRAPGLGRRGAGGGPGRPRHGRGADAPPEPAGGAQRRRGQRRAVLGADRARRDRARSSRRA